MWLAQGTGLGLALGLGLGLGLGSVATLALGCRVRLGHPGVLVAKVGYFGVKSAKVCREEATDEVTVPSTSVPRNIAAAACVYPNPYYPQSPLRPVPLP